MHDSRPAASLTSGLLARRGDARPAMRRPSPNAFHAAQAGHDDLGWNDLGGHRDNRGDFLSEAPADLAVPSFEPEPAPLPSLVEAVVERPAPRLTPVKAAKAAAPRKAAPKSVGHVVAASIGRKAAFTLRLDPERHLRLRLLSAVSHRSAQQLLVEALDALLAQHDQVEDLAGRAKAGDKNAKVGARLK